MQHARESSLRFNLRRFSKFFRLMFGNRMAALGLIMLIISIGAALLAPVFYPGNPQQIASAGGNAQPEWLMYFSEGYYLSRNLVIGTDPNFASPATLQEWSYGYNPAQSPYISISRSTLSPSAPPSGSLQITSSSNSNLNLTVSRTFHYPYRGPPAKFVLQPLRIEAQGASPAQPILVRLYITRGTDQSYTMWSTNVTTNNAWIGPQYTLDSHVAQLHASAGLGKLNQLSLEAAIFSQVNDYVLGVSIDFAAPGTVNLTGLGLTAPGTAFGLLGSDNNGGDLFAQDLWGARISLFVGLISAFIGIGLGLLIGLIAGYKSGLVDESLMRFTDMMLVLPALPLLLVLITVLGQSVFNIILLIGFLGWMGFARVIRSQVLSLATRPFIEAAKAAGAGTGRILTTHVFPNVVSLTYVNLALSVPAAILTEAALSFLGLGAPTVISWGQIINNAETANSLHNWWWVIPPGVAIAFVSLSFVLIGYALDEIFNPKLRRRQ